MFNKSLVAMIVASAAIVRAAAAQVQPATTSQPPAPSLEQAMKALAADQRGTTDPAVAAPIFNPAARPETKARSAQAVGSSAASSPPSPAVTPPRPVASEAPSSLLKSPPNGDAPASTQSIPRVPAPTDEHLERMNQLDIDNAELDLELKNAKLKADIEKTNAERRKTEAEAAIAPIELLQQSQIRAAKVKEPETRRPEIDPIDLDRQSMPRILGIESGRDGLEALIYTSLGTTLTAHRGSAIDDDMTITNITADAVTITSSRSGRTYALGLTARRSAGRPAGVAQSRGIPLAIAPPAGPSRIVLTPGQDN